MESKFILDPAEGMGWGMLCTNMLYYREDSAGGMRKSKKVQTDVWSLLRETLKIDLVTDVFGKKIREKQI